MQLASPLLTLNRPHPAPAMTPEGPLMLSIHPGIGSSLAAVTRLPDKLGNVVLEVRGDLPTAGLKMQIGRPVPFKRTTSSETAFVRV